jgi:ABC-type branched-subunit amino acid transport system ATPase component
MSILEITDVRSGYGRVPVLHGITLTVEPGELVGVLGANGAGKSTLLKTISRVLPLMGGQILFDGTDVSAFGAHKLTKMGLGYVPQEGNVFPDLNVADNLQLGGYTAGRGWRDALKGIFAHFPILEERLTQRASTLSGGERQMLAIACALMVSPKMLMLDEPNSGLSPLVSAEVIGTSVKINKEMGTSVLWVIEENPRDVLVHCDRVYFVESGTIVREDTGKALLEDPRLDAMFLGHAGA